MGTVGNMWPRTTIRRYPPPNSNRLVKRFFGACSVDICFTGNISSGIELDIRTGTFYNNISSIGFTALDFSGASTSHSAYVVLNTNSGSGYNTHDPVYGGGVSWTFDFLWRTSELCSMLGIPLNYICNTGATYEQMAFALQNIHTPQIVALGLENKLQAYDQKFPQGGVSYKNQMVDWCTRLNSDVPGVTRCGDAAPVETSTSRDRDWNDNIQGLDVKSYRIYLMEDDLFADYLPADFAFNMTKIDETWDTLVPARILQYKAEFPNYKCEVWQWGLRNTNQTAIYNTFAGCYWIARGFMYFLEYNRVNDDFFNYCSFMSVKSLQLNTGTPKIHFYALKQCGRLMTANARYTTTDISLTDCVSAATTDSGKTRILIANKGGTDRALPATINSKSYTVLNQWTVSATSAQATTITESTTVTNTVPKYSITVIEI